MHYDYDALMFRRTVLARSVADLLKWSGEVYGLLHLRKEVS